MAQIITWWWAGENGTLTYWPDGPLGPPKVLEHPLWNKGLVVQNELMFHRGDPVGPYDSPTIDGLKNRSMMGYDADAGLWRVTTDDETLATFPPEQVRLVVHWRAELYEDMDELKKVMDHSDDLTIERAVGMLLDDMRSKGATLAEPSDPLNDPDFVSSLIKTYTIAPATEWLEVPPA